MYRGVVIRAIETVKRGTKHEFVSAMLRSFIREVTLSLSLSLSRYTHNIYNENWYGRNRKTPASSPVTGPNPDGPTRPTLAASDFNINIFSRIFIPLIPQMVEWYGGRKHLGLRIRLFGPSLSPEQGNRSASREMYSFTRNSTWSGNVNSRHR